MIKNIIYLLPIILLAACAGNEENETTPGPLYPEPQTIELNTEQGYRINQVTGDSIQPIITENGDTLITGVPIPTQGKIIHPDSVAQPVSFQLIVPDSVINALPNVHKVPDELTIISVNKDALTQIVLQEIPSTDTSHYFINGIGDTLLTGRPIPIQGKKVVTTQPQPTIALSPRFKDAAINNMQYLDVDQGMASTFVFSILEDKRGNLWFGTDGGGVSMYNGEYFTHFTQKEGLSNNIVRSMLEDQNGNLWFGTFNGGVSMFNGEYFTHFTQHEGLTNNTVRAILEDKDGKIWFGTDGGGVSMYNPTSSEFTHFTEKEGLSNNRVLAIEQDKSGNLWFGTDGGGVSIFNPGLKRFTHLTKEVGLSNNSVLTIEEDHNGNMWFGTDGGGASMYNPALGEFTHFTQKEGLSNNSILFILEDKDGELWFGTDGGGVNNYNPIAREFTHFTEKEGLSDNLVRPILEDKSGNLWFGTYGGGVAIHKRESFKHFTEKEGLSNNSVLAIDEDENGNLWLGTFGGGVSMYNGETFTHFTEKEGLIQNSILSILADKNGNIWFGGYGAGLSKFNPVSREFTNFTEKEGLSNGFVRCMLEAKNGNLWFGTYGGGASMYNGEYFTHYTQKEGLSSNKIVNIQEDINGNLWFGTYGAGMSKFNPVSSEFTHFTEKEGLSNNIVRSIFEDKNGNIWFGTYGGGVSKYDPNTDKLTHFTMQEGLSNNIVWSIEEDKRGNLWMSTENGMNLIGNNPSTESNSTFINYEKNDGLKGVTFYPNCVYLDTKHRIWWGSAQCLTMLDLDKHNLPKSAPSTSLNQLFINSQFIDYRNTSDSLVQAIKFKEIQPFGNYPIGLALPYNQNHLTFHFSAIDWAAPHKIKYSYIMEGLNTTWSKPNAETKADFRNIPYGVYTFKVRAIGESAKWSEAYEYKFTINPPWWHTWWARVFYAIGGILLFFAALRWRTAQLKQRQKELETEVEVATQDLLLKNQEISQQKEQVEEVHKEITDSINYAERIQRSFLATKELLGENLNEYFVFFKPKGIVSGDFYWAGKLTNGNFAMVNADSTGHGVPGAIMSILNISSIEKAIEQNLTNPAEIFNNTRNTIIERLKKDGSEEGGKDGMDASIICFDFEKNKFFYTAAQNPIWVIRNGGLIAIKPEKMPIGKHDKDHIPFVGGEFEMQKGDLIYTLTDGFQDQFGGPKGKKFMIKKMREYILTISHLPLKEQKQQLKEAFTNWKGDLEQVDDVCVIGIRV